MQEVLLNMHQIQKIKKGIFVLAQTVIFIVFMYSGLSKIMHYYNFIRDVASSPLFKIEEVELIAHLLVSIELIIPLLILFDKTKSTGLYASLFFASTYLVYIIFLIFFGAYNPCGCGGILDDLNSTEHIVFNLVLVLVATFACINAPSRGMPNNYL